MLSTMFDMLSIESYHMHSGYSDGQKTKGQLICYHRPLDRREQFGKRIQENMHFFLLLDIIHFL